MKLYTYKMTFVSARIPVIWLIVRVMNPSAYISLNICSTQKQEIREAEMMGKLMFKFQNI